MSQHRVRERRAGSGGFSKRVEEIVQYDDYRIYFFFFLLPFLYRFFLFVSIFVFCYFMVKVLFLNGVFFRVYGSD